jgi:hypothetical protein
VCARSQVALNGTQNESLLAVWQPWTASLQAESATPYRLSMCRAVSHDAGRSWRLMGTIDVGKVPTCDPLALCSFGVSPRLAFAPVPDAAQPDSGMALMTLGRASYLGAGLALWVTNAVFGSAVPAFADAVFNIAALHNDGLPMPTGTTGEADESHFTLGFVAGGATDPETKRPEPAESSSIADLHVLESNTTHVQVLVLYTLAKGVFLPDWYQHIAFPVRTVRNQTALFSMKLTVSIVAPPPSPPPTGQQYLTWYDAFPEEQIALAKPGPNLIWRSGNVTELHAQATDLGVKAMWSFNEFCLEDYKVFQEPYCGATRHLCTPNTSRPCPVGNPHCHVCPFGKPCLGTEIVQGKPKNCSYCTCPTTRSTELAVNWTTHVQRLAEMIAPLPNIVGLWMGDEPEIGGMSGDSLCAGRCATVMPRFLMILSR